jgi:hypothetical protein
VKVGDWVRSKKSGYYGLILDVNGGDMAEVLWQGIACNITWIFFHDLVSGVENELVSCPGR